MIVEVFVSQRQTIDPLCQHLLQPMLNAFRIPSVLKTSHQPSQQSNLAVRLAQQEPPTIGGQTLVLKLGNYFSGIMSCKGELNLVTLCHSKSRFLWVNFDLTISVMPEKTAFCYLFLIL